VLLTRNAWDAIVMRKPHYMACLAAFQVSSILFTGAGKVGSENGRPWADFQLSQRADFLETFLGEQTTYNRPIVNARDEPLCAPGSAAGSPGDGEPALARLHVIFFDNTLCQVASLLRAGTMQIVTALLESGNLPRNVELDDPMEALQSWSSDPSLTRRARLVTGKTVTAVELQQRFLEHASVCEAAGAFAGIVPRAREILAMWADTLEKLRERDFESLGRRIDWVLKYRLLTRAMASRPSLSWSSPALRHLDQIYASVDESDGLFWASEQDGLIDRVVSEDQLARALDEPPLDTRAWTRAALLRRVDSTRVEHIDWDKVAIRLDTARYSSGSAIVPLSCPYRSTKNENERVFSDRHSLEEIVAALLHSSLVLRPSG
jgi:proteasome accessory factor A